VECLFTSIFSSLLIQPQILKSNSLWIVSYLNLRPLLLKQFQFLRLGMTQHEFPIVSTRATQTINTERPYSAGHRHIEGCSRLCGRRQANIAPVVQYQTAYSQMISFMVVRTMYMKAHYVNFKCILQQTTDQLHGTYSPSAATSSSGSQISCLS
jgi:hypothetical protein